MQERLYVCSLHALFANHYPLSPSICAPASNRPMTVWPNMAISAHAAHASQSGRFTLTLTSN